MSAAVPPNSPTLKFGTEVRRRRRSLGLTLEQLAERAGLTPNYIGSVENGRRDPSLSTVAALARGLNVSTGELLGGHSDLSPIAFEAAKILDELDPQLADTVLAMLQALKRDRQ